MEYTIQKLARMAAISTRTLRYYDDIGLLAPARMNSSGYRIYGQKEVDLLQQIMFYRELGMELSVIKEVMSSREFNKLSALREHLGKLLNRQARISLLIENVNQTIEKEEGKRTMSDNEKFKGFKEAMIQENEAKYGKEIREKYGEKTIDENNARMMNLTKEQYDTMQAMAAQISELLENAVKNGDDPVGAAGKEAAELHKQWLTYAWSTYSKEAHLGLTQMYVEDERFKAYYDKNVDGCAEFLKAAVEYHLS